MEKSVDNEFFSLKMSGIQYNQIFMARFCLTFDSMQDLLNLELRN